MIELNIEFIEKYKQIDKICRDMFNSKEGISEYISKMEETPYLKKQKCYYFDEFYKQIKHLRWMRNQLAHEQPMDSEFCSDEDIDYLDDFYDNLLKCNDPLAIVYKEENIEKNADNRKYFNNCNQKIKKDYEEDIKYEKNKERKENLSILERIISKIKKWFS